jgi:hypothetical protein
MIRAVVRFLLPAAVLAAAAALVAPALFAGAPNGELMVVADPGSPSMQTVELTGGCAADAAPAQEIVILQLDDTLIAVPLPAPCPDEPAEANGSI